LMTGKLAILLAGGHGRDEQPAGEEYGQFPGHQRYLPGLVGSTKTARNNGWGRSQVRGKPARSQSPE
jgi:hypothetical protein